MNDQLVKAVMERRGLKFKSSNKRMILPPLELENRNILITCLKPDFGCALAEEILRTFTPTKLIVILNHSSPEHQVIFIFCSIKLIPIDLLYVQHTTSVLQTTGEHRIMRLRF
ncbi:hypothetical protein RF11_12747 [Thelohanellus kitauei]|uniref:Uncharacterized protein n=1 Tax=Thelohanellus kitauei TaxID=669202 RepID=A0A0C2I7W7_THEKT|nr:hypothetical protein RF11_12747 [Thelohanellus kitauei]